MDWPIVMALYRLALKNTLKEITYLKDCKHCAANEVLLNEYIKKHL